MKQAPTYFQLLYSQIQSLLKKGKFGEIEERFLTTGTLNISNALGDPYFTNEDMLARLRYSFTGRWHMPQWFLYRDMVKEELIRRGEPWATLMAGLFGTPKWEMNK